MKISEDRLDAVFRALADGTRRAILARLARGPSTVTELAKPFTMSLPAVSKHLRVLQEAGLLRRDVAGRAHCCHLQPSPIRDAAAWIEQQRAFWERQFEVMDRVLAQGADPKPTKPNRQRHKRKG